MKMYYPLRHVEKQSLGLGTSAFLSAGAILAGEGVHATLGHRAIAAFEARTVILPDICTEGLSLGPIPEPQSGHSSLPAPKRWLGVALAPTSQ